MSLTKNLADRLRRAKNRQPKDDFTDKEKTSLFKKFILWPFIALIILIPSYYVIGAIVTHKIDDTALLKDTTKKGASHTVNTIINLMQRELDVGWTPNNPFFFPTALLDNMPNFQIGIQSAVSIVVAQLRDTVARTTATSAKDKDLTNATGDFYIKPSRWVYEHLTQLLPQRPAESYYSDGIKELQSYNNRVAQGTALFTRRSDNLQEILGVIGNDMGSLADNLNNGIKNLSIFSTKADDIFYNVKGHSYAYYQIVKALERDYKDVIQNKKLSLAWKTMLISFKELAIMDPIFVENNSPDGSIFPSHLAAQGFYLMLVRSQLYAINDILLK